MCAKVHAIEASLATHTTVFIIYNDELSRNIRMLILSRLQTNCGGSVVVAVGSKLIIVTPPMMQCDALALTQLGCRQKAA